MLSNTTNRGMTDLIGLLTGHEMRVIFFGCVLLFTSLVCATENKNQTNFRFTPMGSTVLDEHTGLRWQRCSVGMVFNKVGKCSGTAKKLGFVAAQKSINWSWPAGMWRIPTREEMKTIAGEYSPTHETNTEIFPDINKENQFFWTSDMYGNGSAWYADMINGGVYNTAGDYVFLDHKHNIRLVHVEK